MMKLEIEHIDNAQEIKILEKAISDFNGPKLAGLRVPLNIMLKDSNQKIVAGLSASTNWGWLYTRLLWVSEEMRGQALGRRLMTAAETEAKIRNCHNAWVDTFSPDAKAFYEKQGYSLFGKLEDFPQENQRFFLSKHL